MNFEDWKQEMENENVDHFGALFEQAGESMPQSKEKLSYAGAFDKKGSMKSFTANIPDIAPIRTIYRNPSLYDNYKQLVDKSENNRTSMMQMMPN